MTKMRRVTAALLKQLSNSGVPFEFTIAGWPVEHPADEPAHSVPMYTILFSPLYHFPSIADTPATQRMTPVSLHDCLLALLTLVGLVNSYFIAPSDQLCVWNVQVTYRPCCYVFLSGLVPTLFFWWFFLSDLLIHHHDMWQFCLVTWLTLMWANQSQVIAQHGQWVRGLLLFCHKWSLFLFFLDKSFVFNCL